MIDKTAFAPGIADVSAGKDRVGEAVAGRPVDGGGNVAVGVGARRRITGRAEGEEQRRQRSRPRTEEQSLPIKMTLHDAWLSTDAAWRSWQPALRTPPQRKRLEMWGRFATGPTLGPVANRPHIPDPFSWPAAQ